jgi:hypothetical protein
LFAAGPDATLDLPDSLSRKVQPASSLL